jgi:murein L,D-transpeptidase YcbB/YkuD
MDRFGNSRFDAAVSTRGTRGWRADHPSNEGIVFTSQIVTERNAGHCRWAIGAAVAMLLGLAAPYGSHAQAPANGAPALTPVSLPSDPGVPAAAPTIPDTEIKVRLDRSGLAIAGEHLHVGLLRRFYAAHAYEPVWNTRQSQANALLQVVLRAGEHGLDPELFHITALKDPAALPPIDRDLLLSDAFLAYADALARGVLPVELRMDDEDLKPEPIDAAVALETAIASPDPAAAIEALAPNAPEYQALRRALQYYQSAAAAPVSAPAPRGAPGPHQAKSPAAASPALNQTRARQVAINLERWRWLPRSMPADRVWVNTASALLVLYRGNRPTFATRVVVGESDKQTPEVQATISSVLFNPPWNVPRSIAAKEIYPKLSQDPGYLERHHMIVRRNGLIQQQPGTNSALGQIKFEMPNRFDVYLHDTPMKNLFSTDNRRRSHGCVRVQNPRELGALLLQRPVEAIDQRIGLGHTNSLPLPESVPVFFVYQTVTVDQNGALEFRPDFYQRDDAVWQHLRRLPQPGIAQGDMAAQRRG